jgi:predicted Zn-ribbon and HTH transcriptional regulator
MRKGKDKKCQFKDPLKAQQDNEYIDEYSVLLPDELLPDEIKQNGELIEGLDYTVPREPIYCAKCNTVIPVSMIQSTTRCPFCHKEF